MRWKTISVASDFAKFLFFGLLYATNQHDEGITDFLFLTNKEGRCGEGMEC